MRFLLVSDSHLAESTEMFAPNWAATRRFAARAGAALTVHLGDVTLDGASDATHLAYAQAASRDWPTPIRFLPGNHDVGDNPWGPGIVNAHPLSLDRLADYRSRFGADRWALEGEGWCVIGLNAQLLGSETRDEDEQWTWLGEHLDRARDRPVALFLHKPLFQNGPDDAAPHVRYVPIAARRRLLDRMASVDLRIVVSGHTHQYLDRTIDGVRHVWVPSSAFVFPDSMQERVGCKITGLGVLELAGEHCGFGLTRPEGMRQHDLADWPDLVASMR